MLLLLVLATSRRFALRTRDHVQCLTPARKEPFVDYTFGASYSCAPVCEKLHTTCETLPATYLNLPDNRFRNDLMMSFTFRLLLRKL